MSRLWTPDDGHEYDEHDIFDMALLGQIGINQYKSSEERQEVANFMLPIIERLILSLEDSERDLMVAARTAYFDITDKSAGITRNIGMYGLFDGITYIEGPAVPAGFYVGVDAFDTFTLPAYEATEISLQSFHAPINEIAYIEGEAA